MRAIRVRPFTDYFKQPESDRWPGPGFWNRSAFESFFYARRDWFNVLGWFLVLIGLATLAAPWRREALIAALAGGVFLVTLFLRTRATAEGLTVTREAPTGAIEHDRLKVRYTVTNTSAFVVTDLLLRDHFSGARQGELTCLLDGPLRPGEAREAVLEASCDGGMGEHSLGPLVLTLHDLLQAFEVTVTEDTRSIVEVHPEYIPLDEFRLPTSYRSNTFGLYESPVAGQSVNLLGVREYVPGDALKHVHWKLSARHLNLVVKELENCINTDVTLCVDMDARSHIGLKDASSWEYARDAAVSLVHQCLERAARLQFATQELVLPFGAGSEHVRQVTRTITRLRPELQAHDRVPLLEEVHDRLPDGSAVILIACPYGMDVERMATMFRLLQERAINLTAIWIDGGSFTDVLHDTPIGPVLPEMNRQAALRLDRLLDIGGQLCVPSFVLSKAEPLRKSLSSPRVR